MDQKKVISDLKKQYPGKTIIANDSKNATEIICEIDPAKKHPGYSSAVAVIDQTAPHYHEQAAEIYYVLKGKLELFVEGARYSLGQDQYRVIPPGKVHFAKGKATWVLVYSEPGWQKQDHLEVKEKPSVFSPNLSKVCLLAQNFGQMFDFYHELLGLTVANGNKDSDYAEFETGDAKIAIYKKSMSPKIIQAKFGKNNQAMVIGLEVEDLKSAYKFLTDKKVTLLSSITKHANTGIEAFYLEDPQGNLLEIYSFLQ